MARPARLLFSHSTKENSFERGIVMDLSAALRGDYKILLDRTELRLGTDWRSVINSWIKTCDAAILLITPESIDSDFCRYEWDVLSFRHRDDNLPIIPIYYRSTPDDIKGKAHGHYEIGGEFSFDSVPNAVAHVREALHGFLPPERPQKQFMLLAQLLREAVGRENELAIEGAAEKIKLELGEWDLSADKWLKFAVQLMGVGILRAWPALKDLQDYFDARPKTLDDIIDLIGFCSWVHMRSAHLIRCRAAPDAPTDAFGLNAKEDNTAKSYVLSATDRGPHNSWPIAFPSNVFGDDYMQLRQQIEDTLFEAVRVPRSKGTEELKKRIAFKRAGQEPVFVVLRADGLEAGWIARLRADELFAAVHFLILSGETIPAAKVLPPEAMLQPDFSDGFEEQVWSDYADVKQEFPNP